MVDKWHPLKSMRMKINPDIFLILVSKRVWVACCAFVDSFSFALFFEDFLLRKIDFLFFPFCPTTFKNFDYVVRSLLTKKKTWKNLFLFKWSYIVYKKRLKCTQLWAYGGCKRGWMLFYIFNFFLFNIGTFTFISDHAFSCYDSMTQALKGVTCMRLS